MNLTDIWKSLKKVDSEISELSDSYINSEKENLKNVLPGRRSTFMTAQEFIFPFALTVGNTNQRLISAAPITEQRRPLIMTTDGVYCIGRICYEVYLNLNFDITTAGVLSSRTRRDTMARTQSGLSHWLITPIAAFANTATQSPCFDFEWKLEVGSNDRAYALDADGGGAYGGENYLSRTSLLGQNYKQTQFAKPYFLDGNEFLTMSIRPTMVPFGAMLFFREPSLAGFTVTNMTMNIIVSIVTIGHKILGKNQ